jgi:hypothetical protein
MDALKQRIFDEINIKNKEMEDVRKENKILQDDLDGFKNIQK